MQTEYTKTKILITVMTYPHPSRGYQELVCTAGVTEEGNWVRLYPVDYRYRPPDQRFQKYQWIEVELAQRGKGNDNRKESRTPCLESIRIFGEKFNTKNNWEARRKIIDKLPKYTVNELKRLYYQDQTSLGVVRPTRVLNLKMEESDPDWKSEWQHVLNQFHLFGPQPKPLAKIPFKFSYIFECEDSSSPHNAMIEDWELGVLYLKELERLNDERKAAESVKYKFFDQLCAPNKDTHFFMGTVFPYNTWIVLGVFWPPKTPPTVPPKDSQMELFDTGPIY